MMTNKSRIIIGLSSKMQGGKDEFAGIATKEYSALRKDFSDTLKEEMMEEVIRPYNLPITQHHLYGTNVDKESTIIINHETVVNIINDIPIYKIFFNTYAKQTEDKFLFNTRSLMQFHGTDYRRDNYGEDYWVDKTFINVPDDAFIVCPSTRFWNEASAIKRLNGILVRINRLDRPHGSNEEHISEIDLDKWLDWDYVIENNSTLEEYHDKCRKVIKKILENK